MRDVEVEAQLDEKWVEESQGLADRGRRGGNGGDEGGGGVEKNRMSVRRRAEDGQSRLRGEENDGLGILKRKRGESSATAVRSDGVGRGQDRPIKGPANDIVKDDVPDHVKHHLNATDASNESDELGDQQMISGESQGFIACCGSDRTNQIESSPPIESMDSLGDSNQEGEPFLSLQK
jgi:hypothetical protein